MIFALLLSSLLGREIIWTDTTIGSAPISNTSGSGLAKIRSMAELVAIMDHTILQGNRDDFRPNDSLIRVLRDERCRIGVLDTMDGVKYALLDWRKDGSGFTYMVGIGRDSMELFDYSRERPKDYLRDRSGVQLTWTKSGKKCEGYSYGAIFQRGEFRFDPDSSLKVFGKTCKDKAARKALETTIRKESYRRTEIRCDVSELFPSVGSCWDVATHNDEENLEEDLDEE